MDTKLKKRRPGITYFFFMLAVSGLIAAGGLALLLVGGNSVVRDYRDSYEYRNLVMVLAGSAYRFALGLEETDREGYLVDDDISVYIVEQEDDGSVAYAVTAAESSEDWQYYSWASIPELAAQGSDIYYLVANVSTGEVVTNQEGEAAVSEWIVQATNADLTQEQRGQACESLLNEGYREVFYFEGPDMHRMRLGNGQTLLSTRQLTQAPSFIQFKEAAEAVNNGSAGPVRFYLAVKDPSLFEGSDFSIIWNDWRVLMTVLLCLANAAGLCLLILLVVFVKHKSLALAGRSIAAVMGHIILEAKLVLFALALTGVVYSGSYFYWNNDLFFLAVLIGAFWWCWFTLTDLCINRRRFFAHNLFTCLLRFLRSLENKYPFLERMKRRFIYLVAAEAALLLVTLLVLLLAPPIGLLLSLFTAGCGVALLVLYIAQYNRNMDEFGLIVDYVEQIKKGEAQGALCLPEEDDFAPLAQNLSEIHSGIHDAVEAKVRSERMKVELITNVSHDLKTPLTSIINYVDLLRKESLQPDYANDYVRILEQKSARLKNLVQDLFEVSKANSGSIDLYIEQLDLVALLKQTVAEMDERMNQSGVSVKEQFDAEHLFVQADGKKLHRVFENLLGNALKYSLAGTRVYISAKQAQGGVQVTFKNIANYEMEFSPEDIVERFQRGDASRATEGSGLGLAIAKSFLELCGGSLTIQVDGDLFKAVVFLPGEGEREHLPEDGTDDADADDGLDLSGALPEPLDDDGCNGFPEAPAQEDGTPLPSTLENALR